MTRWRLCLLGCGVPDFVVRTRVPSWEPGCWVKAYDPAVGLDSLVVTLDPDEALTFPDSRAAMELWKAVLPSDPVRPDGKPNRPLSAFTASPEKVADV